MQATVDRVVRNRVCSTRARKAAARWVGLIARTSVFLSYVIRYAYHLLATPNCNIAITKWRNNLVAAGFCKCLAMTRVVSVKCFDQEEITSITPVLIWNKTKKIPKSVKCSFSSTCLLCRIHIIKADSLFHDMQYLMMRFIQFLPHSG